MYIDNNEYSEITISSDKFHNLSVENINYGSHSHDKLIRGGLGQSAYREVVRGRPSYYFNMSLDITNWNIIKSYYSEEQRGIFTVSPTSLIVTYKNYIGETIAQDKLELVFNKEDSQYNTVNVGALLLGIEQLI